MGGGYSAAASAAAAAAGVTPIAACAAMPPLVSGEMPPTRQEKWPIQFFWLWDREMGRTHTAQMVIDHPPLLLHLPDGVSQDEVMDLMGEFSSRLVPSLVCC
jgi:hypothetical protein